MILRKVRMGISAIWPNFKSMIEATRHDDAQKENLKKVLSDH